MKESNTGFRLRTALHMPSFFGAVTWGVWFLLYQLRLVDWDQTFPATIWLALVMFLAFAASQLLFHGAYRSVVDGAVAESFTLAQSVRTKLALGCLHVVGFIGIALYVRDFAGAMGGLTQFGAALLGASYTIRWLAEETTSIGIQISYVGWIAIALTLHERRRRRAGALLVGLAALQFVANLLFIDRTRPVWILFTTALVLQAWARPGSVGAIARRVVLLGTVFIGLFLGIAMWVGKVPEEGTWGRSPLSPALQNVYAYGTAGFAYLNDLVASRSPPTYTVARTAQPALMVASSLGLAAAPPSQVNEVAWVPFPVNVGTLLEPYLRDGGTLFALVGILIHSFGCDLLGLMLLASRRPLATFAWANLCFVTFIGFFVPKLNTFPIWFFLGLGCMSGILSLAQRRSGYRLTADRPVSG